MVLLRITSKKGDILYFSCSDVLPDFSLSDLFRTEAAKTLRMCTFNRIFSEAVYRAFPLKGHFWLELAVLSELQPLSDPSVQTVS